MPPPKTFNATNRWCMPVQTQRSTAVRKCFRWLRLLPPSSVAACGSSCAGRRTSPSTTRSIPWMDPTAPVDAAWPSASGSTLRAGLPGPRPHGRARSTRCPACPTWSSPPTARTVVDGKVLAVQFRDPQRADEGPAYRAWFERAGFEVHEPEARQRGRGRRPARRRRAARRHRVPHRARRARPGAGGLRPPGDHPAAGRPALLPPGHRAVPCSTSGTVAYLPEAFSPGSQAVLRRLFPDAVIATIADAEVLGLNAVSDGRHVVLPGAGHRPGRRRCASAGYETIGVDLSELRKAGGGPKCCTLEVRQGSMIVDDMLRTPAAVRDAERWTAHNYHPLPVVIADGRGRLGDRRRRPALPRLPRRLLGAELRPPPPGADRRRARPARPAHADQPRVPPRPVRRRSATSWPSCAARTWCCR